MANNFTTNPIVVDTVMTGGYQAAIGAAAGNQFPLYPKTLIWYAPALAGDLLSITDPVTGRVLLNAKCETANQHQTYDLRGATWADFKVSTLGSGKVYLTV